MRAASNDVATALQMAREALDGVLQLARDQGAQAFRQGDATAVDEARRQVELVTECRRQLDLLSELCDQLSGGEGPNPLPPAAHLPDSVYVFPILRILEQAGGSATKTYVIGKIEEELGDRFTVADLARLAGGPERWKNRAAFVRNYHAQAGFISRGTKRGIWAITEAGRRELAAGDLDATLARLRRASRRPERSEGQ